MIWSKAITDSEYRLVHPKCGKEGIRINRVTSGNKRTYTCYCEFCKVRYKLEFVYKSSLTEGGI